MVTNGEKGHPTVEQFDDAEAREALLAAIERRYPGLVSVLGVGGTRDTCGDAVLSGGQS